MMWFIAACLFVLAVGGVWITVINYLLPDLE